MPHGVRSQPDGLSPRVRGNPQPDGDDYTRVGSIPACAGEPNVVGRLDGDIGVYPRVCGGTFAQMRTAWFLLGLSPRVRGNRNQGTPHRQSSRSIPACAGEPPRVAPMHQASPVYPRVCGGTSASWLGCGRKSGLSPRVRGETFAQMRPTAWFLLGLSPRVRGNRVLFVPVRPARGSIPACAGEPRRGPGSRGGSAVYPRVCGGTSRKSGKPSPSPGLSPRVRGNRFAPSPHFPLDGSIPACAGEPHRWRTGSTGLGVYPRVCGGTSTWSPWEDKWLGLSPRVRGNR